MRKNNLILISILLMLFACSPVTNEEDKRQDIQFDSLNQIDNEVMNGNKEYVELYIINEYKKRIEKAKTALIGEWQLLEIRSKDTLIEYKNSDIFIEFIDSSKVILNKTISCTYDFPMGGKLELDKCNYKKTWWSKPLILSSVTNDYLHFHNRETNNLKEFRFFIKFKKIKAYVK